MKHEEKSPFKCCPSCRKTLLVLSAALLPFQLLAGCQGEVYRRMWLDSMVEELEMQPAGWQPVIPTYLHNNSQRYRARVTPPNCLSVRPSLWLCRGEVWGRCDVTTGSRAWCTVRVTPLPLNSSSLQVQSFCPNWLSQTQNSQRKGPCVTSLSCESAGPHDLWAKSEKRETHWQCMKRGKS